MKIVSTNIYKSFDGKDFDTEEECLLYEQCYLTDEQLEKCFHFFHAKHEDVGDIETAKKPSDATCYKFKILRSANEQSITLYECYISYKSEELRSDYTKLGLTINPNLDFVVYHDAIDQYSGSHYQGKCTYNIKDFYKFLDQIKQ